MARNMLRDGTPTAAYPLETWGYQEVGRVDAVGDGIDAVARHRGVGRVSHHGSALVDGHGAARQRLPDDDASVHGIFTRIGAVRLKRGARRRRPAGRARGGVRLGVPGLLAVQLARRSGGRVTTMDRVDHRLALAAEHGAYQLRRHP